MGGGHAKNWRWEGLEGLAQDSLGKFSRVERDRVRGERGKSGPRKAACRGCQACYVEDNLELGPKIRADTEVH